MRFKRRLGFAHNANPTSKLIHSMVAAVVYSGESELWTEFGVLRGIDHNIDVFYYEVENIINSLAPGDSASYAGVYSSHIDGASVSEDWYYTAGTTTLQTQVNLTIDLDSGGIPKVSGSVTHLWWDIYDWDRGKSTVVPTGKRLEDTTFQGLGDTFTQYSVKYEQW